MIDGLKPYPKYKDSGVPWLGEVPEHWEVLRNGRLFAERREVGFPDLPVLEVSLRTGVRVRSDDGSSRKQALGDLSVYKRARAGDIAYNMMRMWQGAVGVAPVDGLVSPAYVVARPFHDVDSRYFDYLFRTPAYMGEVNNYSRGIVADRNRLYWDEFKDIRSPVPPLEEQILIVRFLRAVDQRIGRYIRARKKLIALLNEQRQAMSEDAVRNVTTLESYRIAVIAQTVQRSVGRRDDELYTPVGLFNRGRGMFRKQRTTGAELGDSDFFWIEEGDLVLSGQFAWEGSIALATAEDSGCVTSHRYHILRGRAQFVETAYLLSHLQTTFGQMLLDTHSRGAAGRNRPLNIGALLKEKIPIPSLLWQRKIAALVQLEHRVQEVAAASVQCLQEFRARLISDLVTGQLDVRNVATCRVTEHALDELEKIGEIEEVFDTEGDAEVETPEVEE